MNRNWNEKIYFDANVILKLFDEQKLCATIKEILAPDKLTHIHKKTAIQTKLPFANKKSQ